MRQLLLVWEKSSGELHRYSIKFINLIAIYDTSLIHFFLYFMKYFLKDTVDSLFYLLLPFISCQHYLRYIRGLPINDTPEIFALHDNANITFAQNETFSLLQGILKMQPRASSGAGRSREEVCV